MHYGKYCMWAWSRGKYSIVYTNFMPATLCTWIQMFSMHTHHFTSLKTLILTGSEERGHFVQNANFYHFSNCHHTKAFRALGFPTELQTL